MKKLMAVFICIVLLCAIVLPASATIQGLEASYTDMIEKAVAVSVNQNGSYTYSISAESLSEIKSTMRLLSGKNVNSDAEFYDRILEALGFSESEVRVMRRNGMDDVLPVAGFIVTNATYYKRDAQTNEVTIISESEFNQVCDAENTASMRNGGSSTTYTSDGYFKITTSATYLPDYIRDEWEDVEEDGWFLFGGTVTHIHDWHTNYEDAISLFIDPSVVSWGDTSTDFSSNAEYRTSNGRVIEEEKVSLDRHINVGGAYYTWDIEPSADITIGISGYGRVCNYNSNSVFDVYTGYVDYYIMPYVDFEFSFSWSSFGITVTTGFEEYADQYYGRCQVSYNP